MITVAKINKIIQYLNNHGTLFTKGMRVDDIVAHIDESSDNDFDPEDVFAVLTNNVVMDGQRVDIATGSVMGVNGNPIEAIKLVLDNTINKGRSDLLNEDGSYVINRCATILFDMGYSVSDISKVLGKSYRRIYNVYSKWKKAETK